MIRIDDLVRYLNKPKKKNIYIFFKENQINKMYARDVDR